MLIFLSGKELKGLLNKKERENFAPRRTKHEETSQLLTEESSDAGSGFGTSKEDKTQQEEKNRESFEG